MWFFSLFFLNQSVGQVHAEDADDGINGEIYYSSSDPKSSFAVDPVTGVISLTRPLSYQKKPQHDITIMAQDRGAKSRFATRAPDTAKVHLSVRQVRKKNCNSFKIFRKYLNLVTFTNNSNLSRYHGLFRVFFSILLSKINIK